MSTSWTEVGDSAANTAKTVTHAAEADRRHHVTKLTVSIRGAASGNDVRVEIRDEDDTVLWDAYVDAVRGIAIQEDFETAIELDTNKDVKVVVAAAGALAIATISVGGFTVP